MCLRGRSHQPDRRFEGDSIPLISAIVDAPFAGASGKRAIGRSLLSPLHRETLKRWCMPEGSAFATCRICNQNALQCRRDVELRKAVEARHGITLASLRKSLDQWRACLG